MSKTEKIIRIVSGFTIFAVILSLGLFAYSPWNIPIIAVPCTILYILGKEISRIIFLKSDHVKRCVVLAKTYISQLIFCAVLYVLGRGMNELMLHIADRNFSSTDLLFALGLLILGIINEVLLACLKPKPVATTSGVFQQRNYTISFQPEPITIDNFYSDPFWGHKNNPDLIKGDLKKIEEAERRLGVILPPLLKELYLKQNGGMAQNLYVPIVDNPGNDNSDWRWVFSPGYEYLNPAERLCNLKGSCLLGMDEDEIEQEGDFLKNAEKYIVLCKRYSDVTFLDYSGPGEPRVGVVDFDKIDPKNVWFNDFEQFFKALRRGELE